MNRKRELKGMGDEKMPPFWTVVDLFFTLTSLMNLKWMDFPSKTAKRAAQPLVLVPQ